jgi:cytochrome c peroxidase
LERQVEVTVGNPNTMANSWPKVLEVLMADPAMVAEFKAAYGGDNSLTQKNVIDAVVTYEKSLVTRSRFDDWLSGNDKAITATEKLGYEKFKHYGCVACHNGITVGGNLFANLGFVGDYFEGRVARGKGEWIDFDKGRMMVTGKAADLHVFRVPSLRNVALTAPYFHDGAVETLDEAILLMGRHQLGVDLPAEDRRSIAAFLGSLTGKTLEKNMPAANKGK